MQNGTTNGRTMLDGSTEGSRSRATQADHDIDLLSLARTGPVHFVGICGAGMSALAELVLRSGGQATGCDLRPGDVGRTLSELGASISKGHDPGHVAGAVAVVATAAVPADHPELEAARARGIPVLKRAAALGALVNRGTVVAIGGTHGKTTTTALTSAIAVEANLDPTSFVGGRVPGWGGGLRAGSDRLFIVEADEFDRSFHTLRPDVAVVTAVEADHLDIFGSVEAVEQAFLEFVRAVPSSGLIAGCVDDEGAARLLAEIGEANTLGYGLSPDAALRAVDLRPEGGGTRFRLEERGEALGELVLPLPGVHNVRNALAAVAAARRVGADIHAARRALASFRGVGRRFEVMGEAGGVVVVDDYAHHPTEIEATLAAARTNYPERRLIAIFQPHLYTRTRDFANEFGRALAAADVVWVTDVFPAREQPIAGVTGDLVARAAAAAGALEVRYHDAPDGLAPEVAKFVKPGDLCLTMGAGNIDETGRAVLAQLMDVDGSGEVYG